MNTGATYRQPWIGKAWTDILFILLPPFGCLLFIACYPQLFQNNAELSDSWWILLILLVDVAHVYSTLYRTYFDGQTFQRQKALLTSIPFFAFVAGVVLYSISSIFFWRLLAYTAVFHFIRQQYGFMRIYSRKENIPAWCKKVDIFTIYYATIFPILYWHLSSPRNFNWFIAGDFLQVKSAFLLNCFYVVYIAMIVVYVIKELWLIGKTRKCNVPRIAIITGTILSWYFGIVYFNGDMAFTLLNVVSHGIPYMALVWIHGIKNKEALPRKSFLNRVFSRYGIILFLLIIFLLAYLEEGLWDMMVWKERDTIFTFFASQKMNVSSTLLNIIVPLLALPQITHYVIDGFIWKIKQDNFKWNNEVAQPGKPI
ncbi:MAG: hypothetical protein V4722_11875 [Bacteroidota bacterium]